jgi:hypothetical protein
MYDRLLSYVSYSYCEDRDERWRRSGNLSGLSHTNSTITSTSIEEDHQLSCSARVSRVKQLV